MKKVSLALLFLLVAACSPQEKNQDVSVSSSELQSASGIISTVDSLAIDSVGTDVTGTLTIKTNSSELKTANVTLQKGDQGLSLLTSVCSSFNNSRTCTVRVKFTAASKFNGSYSDSVIIEDLVVPVVANLNKPGNDNAGLQASLGTDVLSSLSFGTLSKSQSVTKIIVLKDINKKAAQAVDVAVQGSDFVILGSSSCPLSTINSTAGCSIRLQFSSGVKAAGDYSNQLTFGGKTLELQATITGTTVTTGSPDIKIQDNSSAVITEQNFGTLALGNKSSATIKIKNEGTATSSGNTLAISGVNAASFFVTGSTCSAALAAGATCSFVLNTSSGAVSGEHLASLSYGGKNLALKLTISGQVVPPKYTLTLIQPHGSPTNSLSSTKLEYNAGETATISLSYNALLYNLSAWGGACVSASGNSCQVVMNENKTVSVSLLDKPQPTLAIDLINSGNPIIASSSFLVEGSTTNLAANSVVQVNVNSIPYIFAVPPKVGVDGTYSFELIAEGYSGLFTLTVSSGSATDTKIFEVLDLPTLSLNTIDDDNRIYMSQLGSQGLTIEGVSSNISDGEVVRISFNGEVHAVVVTDNTFKLVISPAQAVLFPFGSMMISASYGSSMSSPLGIEILPNPEITLTAIAPIVLRDLEAGLVISGTVNAETGQQVSISMLGVYSQNATVVNGEFSLFVDYTQLSMISGATVFSITANYNNLATTSINVEILDNPLASLDVIDGDDKIFPDYLTYQGLTVTGVSTNLAEGSEVIVDFGETSSMGQVGPDGNFSAYFDANQVLSLKNLGFGLHQVTVSNNGVVLGSREVEIKAPVNIELTYIEDQEIPQVGSAHPVLPLEITGQTGTASQTSLTLLLKDSQGNQLYSDSGLSGTNGEISFTLSQGTMSSLPAGNIVVVVQENETGLLAEKVSSFKLISCVDVNPNNRLNYSSICSWVEESQAIGWVMQGGTVAGKNPVEARAGKWMVTNIVTVNKMIFDPTIAHSNYPGFGINTLAAYPSTTLTVTAIATALFKGVITGADYVPLTPNLNDLIDPVPGDAKPEGSRGITLGAACAPNKQGYQLSVGDGITATSSVSLSEPNRVYYLPNINELEKIAQNLSSGKRQYSSTEVYVPGTAPVTTTNLTYIPKSLVYAAITPAMTSLANLRVNDLVMSTSVTGTKEVSFKGGVLCATGNFNNCISTKDGRNAVGTIVCYRNF